MRTFLSAIALTGWCLASLTVAAAAPAIGLTHAAQVLDLTATQAAQALPVELRGVVVDEAEPRHRAVILADPSASVYLFAAANLFAPYHQKDLLLVKGVTSQGQFAPCVLVTDVRKLGTADLPAARPVTYQQLITGALDAQYVEITGVVRRCWPAAPGSSIWRILLAADGGIIPVRLSTPLDPKIQEDAEVTVQAVCLYQFNQRRQALNPVLQIPLGMSVRVNSNPPSDPYVEPVRSSVSLLQYSRDIPYGHRVHVRGVVTGRQGSSLWIHDASAGLRIETQQTNSLQPGDEIDALGFPGYGSSSPMLEDAIFRKFGTVTPPTPSRISNPTNAFDHQDDLISLHATLTDVQPVINGLVLTMEQDQTVFKASLDLPSPADRQSGSHPDWQPGSLVRVAGICDVIYDDPRPVMGIWHPQSFQILLRSPADLTILKAPPWWTAGHIMLLLGIFAGGSLAVSGVVTLVARRRLHEQAHRRAMAEAEFAAILSERNRLAREIHDTLAQGLTATSVQLQLVKIHSTGDSDSAKQHIELAQQMVRESLEEARNSIWNMRPQVLETGDLAGALKNILKQLADGVVAETGFEVAGRERRLPAIIETNVLRIGQEAITNAVKHAQAGHLRIKLDFGEKNFSLTVADDGRGFDAAHPPPSDGGFGLVAMQERAKELNGQLKVRSAPGQGVEIALSVPLAGA